MFLTQPPVSRIHATWKFERSYMKMEMNNDLGVRVTDLIEHLQEFGRMPSGENMVGMKLTALSVYCARRQIPNTTIRESARKTSNQPSARMRWREMWVDENAAIQAAMNYL